MFRISFSTAVGLLALALAARAEPAAGEAEAGRVVFRLVRPAAGAPDPWGEATVDLVARPAPDSRGGLLPRVRVTLILATEIVAIAAPRRLEYYRASAEAVALPAGHSAVRFYLPPEIVRQDAVRGEVRRWSVEIAVAGRRAAPRTHFSIALDSLAARREFTAQAAAASGANDGLLLPQYLTPFAGDYPTATPSFVRREPAG